MLSSSRLPLDPAQPQAAEPSPASLASAGLAVSDGELLRLFTRHGDAAAFERLLERHGEMVWRVCRVTLRRQQDAEDAFQATFLILARSARQIGASDSAAGWLYRVAHRTSLRARKRLAMRREEALALDPAAPPEEEFPDLWRRRLTEVLAEELMALPLKYQTPLVMRYLEGQSRRAIAEATDSTIQTVQGRLAQGKRLLRRRMVRRGVTLATAMSALSVKLQPADAASPHVFTQTLSSATALTTSGALAASAAVVSLYREGTRTMLVTSMTKPTLAAAACGLAAITLMAPATEPTVQPTEGIVLSAMVAADESEEVDAVAVEVAPDGGGAPQGGSPRVAESDPAVPGASLTGAPPPPGFVVAGRYPTKADEPAIESAVTEPLPYPTIVESVPEHGATDVDPGLAEVRVTFDRDMSTGGYSWTGNEKSFMPKSPDGAVPKWIDKRTCVLPVKLSEGEFYRVGINAPSFKNFKSAEGVPAAVEAIAFATKGAKRSVAARARVPQVVKLLPEQNADTVDPSTTALRVTFDTTMESGFSWTKSDEGEYPGAGDGKPTWSRDGKTCTLPVKLEPGKTYAIGLNHGYYTNFQTKWFVPLKPLVWKFTTSGASVE